MNSCLYECKVVHRRLAPRIHEFAYRIFLFAIDLDELDVLYPRCKLLSVNRPNLYSFSEKDYLPTGEPIHNASVAQDSGISIDRKRRSSNRVDQPCVVPGGLKERVKDYVRARGVELGNGRVVLITLPRVFGTLFNPVSFYFCFDEAGSPIAAVAEVTNTFREMKPFFLGTNTRALGEQPSFAAESSGHGPVNATPVQTVFRLRVPKDFYVSPFSDVDVEFDFCLRSPGERLSVQIDDYTSGRKTFQSALSGRRAPLTSSRLAWYTIKYPLLTLRIITLIHWHALLLWSKKIPWFAKAARSADQRDLYRAHSSVAGATSHSPVARGKSPAKNDALHAQTLV